MVDITLLSPRKQNPVKRAYPIYTFVITLSLENRIIMTGKWIYAGAIAPHGPLYGVGSRSTGDSAARYKWKGNEGYTSESVVGGGDTGALSGIQTEDGFVCARRRGEPCHSPLLNGRTCPIWQKHWRQDKLGTNSGQGSYG